MEILRVENLSKIYGKGETAVKALDDVTFLSTKGEFIAIIGTIRIREINTLHILGGVDTPTNSKVLLKILMFISR